MNEWFFFSVYLLLFLWLTDWERCFLIYMVLIMAYFSFSFLSLIEAYSYAKTNHQFWIRIFFTSKLECSPLNCEQNVCDLQLWDCFLIYNYVFVLNSERIICEFTAFGLFLNLYVLLLSHERNVCNLHLLDVFCSMEKESSVF